MTSAEYGTIQWAIDTLQGLIEDADNSSLYDEDVDAIKMGIEALKRTANETITQ